MNENLWYRVDFCPSKQSERKGKDINEKSK